MRSLYCLFLGFWLTTQIALANPPTLVSDQAKGKTEGAVARNFRATGPGAELPQDVDTRGLAQLRASGSAEFSCDQLAAIKKALKAEHIVIVDLREESHGFLNGGPISWYGFRNAANLDMGREAVLRDEQKRLAGLRRRKTVDIAQNVKKDDQGRVSSFTPKPTAVEQVVNESEAAHSVGLDYLRIPVTDHRAPQPGDVDLFVNYVRTMPEGTWLHFHCRAGKGRTTTFMCLYDMLRNARIVSFEDILRRQQLLGGVDLSELGDPTSYKYAYKKTRLEFLRRFYGYAREGNEKSWSEWLENHAH